jgi:TonB family protein
MKLLMWFIAFLGATSFAFPQTTPPSSLTEKKVKALANVAPPPQYPVDPQGRHPRGQGVVLMHVDTKTGWVISAKMQQSTGNKLLDDAAIAAFSHWRFRPGSAAYIHSPITFVDRTPPTSNQSLQPTATPCTICRSHD